MTISAFRMRRASIVLAPFVVFAFGLLGCGSSAGPDPEFETGSRAEVTVDGLHRIKHSGFRYAWLKPEAALGSYDQILLRNPEVAYKREPRRSRPGSSTGNFALSDPQMANFKRFLTEAFEGEFAKSEFYSLSEAPGHQVLVIEPAIIDLVVNVPTRPRPVSDTVFTTSTAVMTLVMQLRDSESGEILARIAERREARAPGRDGANTLYWSNSVTDADAVRRTFRRWARILREKLDRIHEVATPAAAAAVP